MNYFEEPDVILKVIKRGLINKKDEQGNTPLMAACYQDTKLALSLLEMGADIELTNIGGNTALHFACSSRHSNVITNKHLELIKLLIKDTKNIDQENNINETALMNAVKTNMSGTLVHYLIEQGADVNKSNNENDNSFMLACKYNHDFKIFKSLEKLTYNINQVNTAGDTATHHYIKNSKDYFNRNVIDFLVKKGADISIENALKQNSLLFSIKNNKNAITHIIDSMKKQNLTFNKKDIQGCAAIHYLADNAIYDYELIKLLSEIKNTDIDINNKTILGHTPIMIACNDPKMSRILLKYKPDLLIKDNEGLDIMDFISTNIPEQDYNSVKASYEKQKIYNEGNKLQNTKNRKNKSKKVL